MSDSTTPIQFTPERLKSLKKAYQQAQDEKQTQFEWFGHTLMVQYAKYLIQHLDAEFKRQGL